MKKKLVSILLVAAMAVTAGCGSSTSTETTGENTASTAASEEATESVSTASTADSTADADAETAEEETPAINPDIDYYYFQEQPEGTKVRTIITTDGEVDDYDSLHHILLYANDIEIAGIVYSASTFHWQGDGEHTLSEITPDNLNKEDNADELMEYRPQDMGWIEETISEEYAVDYEYLSQNAEGYPTAEELLSVVKVGNVEFEGDVREDTEGSDFIKAAILDDDERPLFIQTWGGFNTVARALISIHDEYGDTDEWDEIYEKVCAKCVILAHSQDKTWKNYIVDLYPDLLDVGANVNLGYYRTYNAVEEAREYFSGSWLYENIKTNHGELMSAYRLLGDGTHYEGEPDEYQFGEMTRLEFGNTLDYDFQQYDWIGEGDSAAWTFLIPVGLRGLENPNLGTWGGRITINGEVFTSNEDGYKEIYNGEECLSGDRWLVAFMQDWAARADWAVSTYEECNHAPEVSAETLDITAAAGETVELTATAVDPDNDALTETWWVYEEASEYSGSETLLLFDQTELKQEFDPELAQSDQYDWTVSFTIPEDAQSGDYFNIVLTIQDDADAMMTRYAQFVVTVA